MEDVSKLYNEERRAAQQPNRLSVIETTPILSDERTLENIMHLQRSMVDTETGPPSHRAGHNMYVQTDGLCHYPSSCPIAKKQKLVKN